MNPSDQHETAPKLGYLVAELLLALGLMTTFWLTAKEWREVEARDAERFHYEADQLVRNLETGLRTCGQAIMGMRDWYSMHEEMSERLWTNYTYTFQAPAHYPGLYDFGFVETIRDPTAPNQFPKLEAHLERMRKRLGPEYKLKLPPGITANLTWYQMPVVWHSYAQWRRETARPFAHYGIDFNQHPDLWSAMNWALGEDRLGLSTLQSIDPDNPSIKGLMVFAPVYRQDLERNQKIDLLSNEIKAANTPQLREDLVKHRTYIPFLRGLIYAGINIESFMEHHLGTNEQAVNFALFVSTNQNPATASAQLIFDNRIKSGGSAAALPRTKLQVRDLPLYGRVLHFELEPGPAFISALDRRSLILAAILGVVATGLLSGFIAYQTRSRLKVEAASAALRQSEAQLQTALRERETLNRDLHDGVLQSLYALGLGLQKTLKLMKRDVPSVEEQVRRNIATVELAMEEVRRHLDSTEPRNREAFDFKTLVAKLVEALNRQGGIPVELHFTGAASPVIPSEMAIHLLQICREAVSNAQRHSGANRITVTVELQQHELTLKIEDDGIGFAPSAARSDGFGLRSMASRTEEIGGEWNLASTSGGGTQITVKATLPSHES